MEKISLLLLFAKKTLIGTAIAGILGLGGISNFFNINKTENGENDKEYKYIGLNPKRGDLPPDQR